MNRRSTGIVCVAAMVGLIIVLDALFLRDRFEARLIVNVGIVAAFGALYLLVLRRR